MSAPRLENSRIQYLMDKKLDDFCTYFADEAVKKIKERKFDDLENHYRGYIFTLIRDAVLWERTHCAEEAAVFDRRAEAAILNRSMTEHHKPRAASGQGELADG